MNFALTDGSWQAECLLFAIALRYGIFPGVYILVVLKVRSRILLKDCSKYFLRSYHPPPPPTGLETYLSPCVNCGNSDLFSYLSSRALRSLALCIATQNPPSLTHQGSCRALSLPHSSGATGRKAGATGSHIEYSLIRTWVVTGCVGTFI